MLERKPKKVSPDTVSPGATPPPPTATPVESQLAREVMSGDTARGLAACRALERWRERQLSFEETDRHATPALVLTIVTSDSPELRHGALAALDALRPDLHEGGRVFLNSLERRLEKRQSESYPSTPKSPQTAMPYAEQQVIIGALLTEATYLYRTYPEQPQRRSLGLFALVALDHALGGKIVMETVDNLASCRPTLPLDLRGAQESLDSLFALKIIPTRTILAHHIHTKPHEQNYTATRTNQLMSILARETNYDSAMMLVSELGRVGDRRAIQAIRQAMFGLVSDQGFTIQFRSDGQRALFRRVSNAAIASIEERCPDA